MSVVNAPDGILIGDDPNNPNDDKLPMLSFDEWTCESNVGQMTAGEVKTITLTGMPTFTGGDTLVVRPLNPQLYNQIHLLITHPKAMGQGSGEVQVVVRNLSSSTLDFGNDIWVVGGWRTNN